MKKHVAKLAEEDGFTLLETLVTVAIVSLLSMIIIGALGQVRTMTAASHKTDQEVRYGAMLNYLEMTLANARPLRLLGRDDSDPIVMDGDGDHVEFVAIVKTGTSMLSLRNVVWKNANDGSHSQFDQVTTPRRLQPERQAQGRGMDRREYAWPSGRHLNFSKRQLRKQAPNNWPRVRKTGCPRHRATLRRPTST